MYNSDVLKIRKWDFTGLYLMFYFDAIKKLVRGHLPAIPELMFVCCTLG